MSEPCGQPAKDERLEVFSGVSTNRKMGHRQAVTNSTAPVVSGSNGRKSLTPSGSITRLRLSIKESEEKGRSSRQPHAVLPQQVVISGCDLPL